MVDAQTTELIGEMCRGNRDAAERLLPLIYDQLHGLAEGYFRRQGAGHTLQPTALVNEAFLKLVDRDTLDLRGRDHFMAVAATAMKQILIDHARRKGAAKHGGGRQRVTLSEAAAPETGTEVDTAALAEAIQKLEALDERKARVVTLRFLGGLDIAQTAGVMGLARSTVTEDWRFARAWLIREIADSPG